MDSRPLHLALARLFPLPALASPRLDSLLPPVAVAYSVLALARE
jgi:hypothetical protein